MRGRRQFAPLLLLLATGRAAGEPPSEIGPDIDLIRVDKSERRMDLYAGGRLVRRIDHIQLGGEPVGPKRFEGDQRTPEGLYAIDWGNPDSAYHLSLHISYPNDRDRAYAAGGQPAGRIPGDWTDGCIAVSNAEIEILWEAVPDGTPIEIVA